MPGRGRGRLILVAVLQVVVTAGILTVVVWRFGLAPLVDAVTQLPWWAYPVGIALGAAGVVAALEASTARGELETDSPALENLLGRAPTPLVDAIRAARL